MAALVYDAALDDDPELSSVAGGGDRDRERQLHAEAESQLEELRASRERLVAAGDAERRRLERNLHDGAQQRSSRSLQLRLTQGRTGPPAAEDLVDAAERRARLSLELRELGAASRRPQPRPAGGARGDRGPLARPGHRRVRRGRAAARAGRARRVLRRVRGARQRRQVLAAERLDPPRTDGVAVIQIADDGIGGADKDGGSGLRGLGDRVEASPDGSTSEPAGRGRWSPRSCPSAACGAMSAERDLDVVLYGATGFVGRLTARYLAEHAPEGARIGLGGRSEAKLARLRGRARPARRRLAAARRRLRRRRPRWRDGAAPRAVATTVGPYQATASRS